MFVASKDPEHQAWIVALTRMVSAVFRRGGNVAFVAEELKQILDPRGGQWAKGRYVPSLVAAIGDILEQHMVAIGFLPRSEAVETNAGTEQADAAAITSLGPACPRCGQPGLIKEEGCLTCLQCSWSKCG